VAARLPEELCDAFQRVGFATWEMSVAPAADATRRRVGNQMRSSAWATSSMMSFGSSMPIDSLTDAREMPAADCCSGFSWSCVVELGWIAKLRIADIGKVVKELQPIDETERRLLAALRLEADEPAISELQVLTSALSVEAGL
jgi:hypothetical protein